MARVVLISGASRGLGRMLAEGFIDSGSFVEIVARTQERVDSTVHDLGDDRCAGTAADLSTEEGIQAVQEALSRRHERVDVVINNAGTSRMTPLNDSGHNFGTWDRVMRLNVAAPFLLVQRLLPMLTCGWPEIHGRSSVLNIGSIDGLRPPDHEAYAYAASKSALHHLTRMMATPLAQLGVRVNAIAAGTFPSRMSAGRLEGKAEANPVGRIGQGRDLVALAHFLASDASEFVNGAVIPLDGGMHNRPFSVAQQLS